MQILGEHAFVPTPLPKTIRGMSGQLLAAMWSNADHHAIYKRDASPDQQAMFCERAVDTNNLELSFAEQNTSLGHTARPKELIPHLTRIDLRAAIRLESAYTFSRRQSRRQQYIFDPLAPSAEWNDGSLFCEGSKLSAREERVRRMAGRKVRGKITGIRLVFNK